MAAPDQDLEVTMEVIDDLSQLEGLVTEMPGPGNREMGREGDSRDKVSAGGSRGSDGATDRFEHDDMTEDDHMRLLESEGDFEEGEDVDDDRFQEGPEEDDVIEN
jgi:hypothetical protein